MNYKNHSLRKKTQRVALTTFYQRQITIHSTAHVKAHRRKVQKVLKHLEKIPKVTDHYFPMRTSKDNLNF